jgi:xanthine dehydrogenase YagT iron-sulfur-binding subunit
MTDEHDGPGAQPSAPSDPSRRRFLKGVGIVGAGAAIADRLFEAELKGGRAAMAAGEAPVSGTVEVALQVNGERRTAQVEPRTTLLNALRNNLDPPVTGPKLVCDMGTCGACTVLLDDKPAYSCLVLAVDAVGKKITTAEGLGTSEHMNAVQAAFIEQDALMCGFCTPGFVTTLSAYLKQNPKPTPEQVRAACQGNFCRCGTYPRVFEAALNAVTGDK